VSTEDARAGRELLEAPLAEDEVATEKALREACLDALKYLVGHGEVGETFAAALDARVHELFGDAQVRLRARSARQVP
jgi:hypothetical protein